MLEFLNKHAREMRKLERKAWRGADGFFDFLPRLEGELEASYRQRLQLPDEIATLLAREVVAERYGDRRRLSAQG